MLEPIARLLHIKPGEGVLTLLMFAHVVSVMFFYYILKPLRSALFLAELTKADLPKAYLLTALVAGPLVTLVFRLSRRISVIVLLTLTNSAIIGTLFFSDGPSLPISTSCPRSRRTGQDSIGSPTFSES